MTVIARLPHTDDNRKTYLNAHTAAMNKLPWFYDGKHWTITTITVENGMLLIEGYRVDAPSADIRPTECRFRLQDEGKMYPRSGCKACGKTITTGLGRECTSHAGYQLPAARQPVAPGKYGIVQVYECDPNGLIEPCARISIDSDGNTPVYATATELREAAHMLNQLAETLAPAYDEQGWPKPQPSPAPTVEERLARLESRIGRIEKWKDNRHAR